jgi:CubicO group peptidase (beta-lactamase class C family)
VGPDTPPGTLDELLTRGAEFDRVVLGVYLPPVAGAGSVALPSGLPGVRGAYGRSARPRSWFRWGTPISWRRSPRWGATWWPGATGRSASARRRGRCSGPRPSGGGSPFRFRPCIAAARGSTGPPTPSWPRAARRGATHSTRRDSCGGDRAQPPDRATRPLRRGARPASRPSSWPIPARWAWTPMRWPHSMPISRPPSGIPWRPAWRWRWVGGGAWCGSGATDSSTGRPEAPGHARHTIYDLASLTKVLGTTSAVMLLAEQGRPGPRRPGGGHPPSRLGPGRSAEIGVTIRDLLLHRGGLPPFRQYFLSHPDGVGIRDDVFDLELAYDPRSQMVYTDIGFKTLAWLVEEVTGEALDAFLARRVWEPLGMADTGFNPPRTCTTAWRPPRSPPTVATCGDRPRRERLDAGGGGGARGALLDRRGPGGAGFGLRRRRRRGPVRPRGRQGDALCARTGPETRVLPAEGMIEFTRRGDPDSSRALGWDTPSGRSSAGDFFSERVVRAHRLHRDLGLGRPGAGPLGGASHEPRESHPRQPASHSLQEGRPRRGGGSGGRPHRHAADALNTRSLLPPPMEVP